MIQEQNTGLSQIDLCQAYMQGKIEHNKKKTRTHNTE